MKWSEWTACSKSRHPLLKRHILQFFFHHVKLIYLERAHSHNCFSLRFRIFAIFLHTYMSNNSLVSTDSIAVQTSKSLWYPNKYFCLKWKDVCLTSTTLNYDISHLDSRSTNVIWYRMTCSHFVLVSVMVVGKAKWRCCASA